MCIRDRCNKILLGMKRECENYTVYDTFGNMVFSFMRLMTLLDEFLQKANEFPEMCIRDRDSTVT